MRISETSEPSLCLVGRRGGENVNGVNCYHENTPAMIVQANTVRFDSITLDNGATLAPVEVAYETYGELNAAKSNAILVLHAFSGDAHAAGISPESGKPGWW